MPHSALPPAEDLHLVQLADIARGGMGMVQLCRVSGGRLDGRFVAVKRLNPAIEQEPEFVNMFLDETWITATINSRHVVKVEAWGRDDLGLYLAVELVQGVSLSRLMKESKEMREPFAERTVAFIMSQMCAGLAAAHGLRGDNGALLGVVHRDLTPGNILVGFDGLVKIADFGIAKAEERLTSTRIGMMKGKPAYMAPEQARGGGIDGRADLFAIGVVMYELLAGRRPWAARTDLETLIAVSTQEPENIQDIRKVSPVFSDIIQKCLKKVPGKRFSSADEIKDLLDGWRRERGFEHDDEQSLAAFVQRNTPQQRAWFQQALAGGLRAGGVTFSDLEARIDAGRKKTSGPQSPAAGPPSSAAAKPPELEEIDDSAQTRMMGVSPAAGAANGPSSGLGSTVALTAEEAVRYAVQSAASRARDLPLPPARTLALPRQPSPASSARSSATAAASPSFAAHVAQAQGGPASGPMSAPASSGVGFALVPSAGFGAAGPQSGPVSPQGSALANPLPGQPLPGDGQALDDLDEAAVWTGAKQRRRWPLVLLVFFVVLAGAAAVFWFVLRPRYAIWT
jgi:serine/threonine protein kinase